IRVWDLNQPYGEHDIREPINVYSLPGYGVSVQFIDNVTVEITMHDGSRIHMNVETGVSTPVE
ncbi:MAG: hypothetical protein H7X77_10310, partial [Anaerolineae bacterium]|nr:hypothetical protein [Anaerolineae bacterium]